jgi:hypothetical protein
MKVSTTGDRRGDRSRRAVGGVGFLAAGAAVAALIGAGAARADDAGTVSATDALGFLDSAATDLTDNKDLLSTAVVPDSWQSTLTLDTGLADTLLGVADKSEGFQDPLLTSHDTVVAETANVLFSGPDQQFAQASDAVLSADKAFVADPSSPTTDFGLIGPDFQMFSATFDQIGPDHLAAFADQLLGLGGTGDSAAAAAADTPAAALDQVTAAVNQGTAALDAAPTADLSAHQADILSTQVMEGTEFDKLFADTMSLQDLLNSTDQASLAGSVDEQVVSASQGMLSADQAFVAADKAGDLNSNGLLPVDWTVAGADINAIGADFNAFGATAFDVLTGGGLDTSSAAAGVASAVDPSIFADALSSIGF